MTSADKFGIAFSIGFTVALIVFAMSFSATSSTPAAPTYIEPTSIPETETPTMEEEPVMEEETVEETVEEEEMVVEEEPVMEEETVEETVEETEVEMSAAVSVPSGSSTPGCEETDECFLPSTVTVGVGGTVTWTNDDTAAHTVTSGNLSTDPDNVGTVFDSSIFMSGKTFEYTFDEAGDYDYFCVVHPWMTGKVIVE
ncbi:MAG: cupredoxin domain-containing protein [Nitrososphaerota archaeon]